MQIVLRGQGKNFCGGMDLSSFDDIARPPDQSCPARRAIKLRQDTMKWQGAFNAMERCRWPVLAAVHGQPSLMQSNWHASVFENGLPSASHAGLDRR